ncbi:MAG TPA: NAD(P)H-binding protein [Anaerolineales bacterium]|nr:NAD(P)H-binding protein [Anaerolineales bacterium]
MILVTGGTGFVGKQLIGQLTELGYPVRTMVSPSPRSPDLPRNVPVEIAVTSLTDERGLRAAMVGVDTVYHLISGEWKGPRASLLKVDIQGTRAVVDAAKDAGVKRIFYLSHLGADRASAYSVLKAKGIAEEFIRRSGLEYTIFRTALAYGQQDAFTTGIAGILQTLPYFFPIPGDGRSLLQPIWVQDLVTCLAWALDDRGTINRLYEIGGPEYFTFKQVVEMVMDKIQLRRRFLHMRPTYLRWMTIALEAIFPNLPVSIYWLEYLATNRTCALDTVPREFTLLPARMVHKTGYLQDQNWRSIILKSLWQRN